ncbi:MAG TPA: hypothetical protein VLL52_25590 [Anaerolineae bacterium]|nr:hypothetical protein [Anaerolineae bacterium]
MAHPQRHFERSDSPPYPNNDLSPDKRAERSREICPTNTLINAYIGLINQ